MPVRVVSQIFSLLVDETLLAAEQVNLMYLLFHFFFSPSKYCLFLLILH